MNDVMLRWDNECLYLGREIIFQSGFSAGIPDSPQVVLIHKDELWIGTSRCCAGYLHCLKKRPEQQFCHFESLSAPHNVFELIPIVMKEGAECILSASGNNEGVVACLHGTYDAHLQFLILTKGELEAVWRFGIGGHYRPVFQAKNSSIKLDYYFEARQSACGQIKSPAEIECFLCGIDLDITERLQGFGVDIEATITLLKEVERFYIQPFKQFK